jgi:hypothetical protein
LDFFLLEPGRREPDGDRRAFTEDALDREGAATDGRPLAHHRHPIVPLGARRLDVEADPVVTQGHLDLVALLALLLDGDPDVRRLRMLERVHYALSGVVVEQQGDRRRDVHLVDVGMEPNVGLARHLREEPTDRLSEPGAPQG